MRVEAVHLALLLHELATLVRPVLDRVGEVGFFFFSRVQLGQGCVSQSFVSWSDDSSIDRVIEQVRQSGDFVLGDNLTLLASRVKRGLLEELVGFSSRFGIVDDPLDDGDGLLFVERPVLEILRVLKLLFLVQLRVA